MNGYAMGGCLCGVVRFQAKGEPLSQLYCHCRDCRRASGAPVLAFTGYRVQDVEFVHDTPEVYNSSPGVNRSFCRTCGGTISYKDERLPGEIYLCTGAFDDPEPLGPQVHSWHSQALGWLHIEDGLPHYQRSSRPR